MNARFLFWVLRRESWASLIAECTRLLRPGGILRLTEPIDIGTTNSLTCEQVKALLYQAMWQAGYGFSIDGRTIGITYMLPRLLHHAGYQNIQLAGHALIADGDAWAACYHNVEVGYAQSIPLLVKAGLISQEEGERLYQQTLIDWHADDFAVLWHSMSFWGTRP